MVEHTPHKDMELLAPAGTVPAFEAALAAGADAVYVGAPGFNARALARDLSLAEIAAMIRFAHGRGRKLYLAMNSLVKEEELSRATDTLGHLVQAGADALIVQDMGLLRLARRLFPQLPLHASTLMAAHNSIAVAHLAHLGCRRVVLARELRLDEIVHLGAVAAAIGIELELFVHGAMCFSYSGLCRFSSLHGGRSSLRGQCVQPCRRRYQWLASGKEGRTDRHGAGGNQGGYLFSMHDLNAVDQVEALAAAGVASLKIEGRLKSVAYVHHTVRAYRLALDACQEEDDRRRAAMRAEARACLEQTMGRHGSSGFLLDGAECGAGLIDPERSGNTGTVVGVLQQVEAVRHRGKGVAALLTVRLRAPVQSGDRLRLHDERSDSGHAFTLRRFRVADRPRRQAEAGEVATIRVNDPGLGTLRPPHTGTLYRVDLSGRQERTSPALAQLIAEQRVSCRATPATRPPASGRSTSSVHGQRKAVPSRVRGTGHRQLQWWLQVASPEALRQRFPFPVSRVLLELTPTNMEGVLAGQGRRLLRSTPLSWVLPPVIVEERLDWYRGAIASLQEAAFSSFQLGHPGQLCLFAEQGEDRAGGAVELFGDASFNLLNHSAMAAMAEQGCSGVQFSLETDRATLQTALAGAAEIRHRGRHPFLVGLLVYGRPALFTSRLRAPHFQGRRSLLSPHGERYFLKQHRDGVCVHPHHPFSLLTHVRELAAIGLDYLVVDISQGQPRREAALISTLMHGKAEMPPHFSGNYAGILA